MNTSITSQSTDFSRDVMGRYICNTVPEALISADPNDRPDAGRGRRPEARPFDIIIVGGGTLGALTAQHLFANDLLKKHRVLVLEAGPFVLPEHAQNLSLLGLGSAPDARTRSQLRQMPAQDQQAWSTEVWGLPWNSAIPFPGLAYCLSGQSLYWDGWSSQPLDSEIPRNGAPNPWPPSVVEDLTHRYFNEAARQLGATETNDFIHSPLHTALRQRIAEKINTVTDAVPLASLPNHPGAPRSGPPVEQ